MSHSKSFNVSPLGVSQRLASFQVADGPTGWTTAIRDLDGLSERAARELKRGYSDADLRAWLRRFREKCPQAFGSPDETLSRIRKDRRSNVREIPDGMTKEMIQQMTAPEMLEWANSDFKDTPARFVAPKQDTHE